MKRLFQLSALTFALGSGAATAADRLPSIPAGTDYVAVRAELTRAGYRPARQPMEPSVCATQKGLCDAFPELRDCVSGGDTPVCLFQWTSADAKTSAYVEASGLGPTTLRVRRAYEPAAGGSPYPLGSGF
jgi:hypothetical protein